MGLTRRQLLKSLAGASVAGEVDRQPLFVARQRSGQAGAGKSRDEAAERSETAAPHEFCPPGGKALPRLRYATSHLPPPVPFGWPRW